MPGDVLECVVYGLNDGVGRDEFLTSSDAVSAWALEEPGFVSRELFETGDEQWIDVLRWSTMDAALSAVDRVAESKSCARFFSFIDEPSVQMLHGHLVITPVRACVVRASGLISGLAGSSNA